MILFRQFFNVQVEYVNICSFYLTSLNHSYVIDVLFYVFIKNILHRNNFLTIFIRGWAFTE
jgi:hypothetical protein